MTLFTVDELQGLLNIVDKNSAILVAQTLGKGFLTKSDEVLLKLNGVDIEKISKDIPPYWQAYLFGRIVGQLSKDQISSLDYRDLRLYVEKEQDKVSERDLEEYRIAGQRTYSYIKGMGQRQREILSSTVSSEDLNYLVEKKRREDVKTIKEKISDGVLRRESVKKITQKIADQSKSWDKDWARITETECQSIYNLGTAQTISNRYGSKTKVYFDVFPGACQHCIRLFLTGGIGSRPKIFNIEDLIENGTNIGRKVREWKPTLYAIHPFCRCNLEHLPDNYVWDKESKSFIPDPNYKHKVERRSKVTVTIGTKKFEI